MVEPPVSEVLGPSERGRHELLQPPDANLSRFMRHINAVFIQRVNRLHHCDGQLFLGRYRSILVDADSYLLELLMN